MRFSIYNNLSISFHRTQRERCIGSADISPKRKKDYCLISLNIHNNINMKCCFKLIGLSDLYIHDFKKIIK
nr:MAG TPA: hypothetical protein [Caudoviricetes sp.]